MILILLTLAGLAIYLYILLRGAKEKKKEAIATLAATTAISEGRQKEIQDLTGKLTELSKYKSITDADAYAKELRSKAEAMQSESKARAEKTISEAELNAFDIRKKAEGELISARNEAARIIEGSKRDAVKIKDEAQVKAREIAEGALAAKANEELYKQSIEAMRNVIEGYGDRYIIPSHSLLDDLAAEYGHTEAGEELSKSRQRSKLMVVQFKNAATCDYVETNRKETAIRFVVDAFNGKVDSILSRVKHDNYGTLQREIKDAFALVNVNGKAFRDARITTGYLDERLTELKWACVVQEIKLRDKEEQRRIKEQMREEEKARREYERAMKDAQKEEEILAKAMEKARKELEKASEEQKGKYELQLRELETKLKEAEEKNQHALSMAQQTKTGHVYVISNIGSFGEDVYKIGLTRRLEPLDRIRELGDASVPFEFDVHGLIMSEDAPALERDLHKRFMNMQMNKVNPRKEFFRVALVDIRNEVERMGISARWTMTAEAREYRETLAMDKALRENPRLQKEWVTEQLKAEKPSHETDEDTWGKV